MEPTTKTIAYSLRLVRPTYTGTETADWLQQQAEQHSVSITGSHIDGKVGALRFRAPSDAAAIALATAIVGTLPGATLESGFGVNRRKIAES